MSNRSWRAWLLSLALGCSGARTVPPIRSAPTPVTPPGPATSERPCDGGLIRCEGLCVAASRCDAVVAVAPSARHTCARLADGAVYCWGRGFVEPFAPRTDASRVGGLSGTTALASGGDHACARRATGAVVCWGDDREGALGDDAAVIRVAPGEVSGLP